jgi:hypothetical protein
MTDLIFSQLEEIGNDTFAQFNPYSLGCDTSNSNRFDDDMTMYDQLASENSMSMYDYQYSSNEYTGYDDFSRNQQPSSPIPDEIKLRGLNLQDQTGSEIENRRLQKVKLKLIPQFFGLEFDDSIKGRSVSQFFPTDIVSIVRQCDRVAIYFQFRKFLTARQWSDDLYTNNATSSNKYYKDTPFGNALFLMIELHDDSEVQAVFEYVGTNNNLAHSLRMVYAGWMYCASMCTASDVHILSCAMQQHIPMDQRGFQYGYNFKSASELVAEKEEQEFEREVVDILSPKIIRFDDLEAEQKEVVETARTKMNSNALEIHKRTNSTPYGWAKRSKQVQLQQKQSCSHSLPSLSSLPKSSNLVIDPTKAKYVLPPAFYRIDDEIRTYAEDLLNKGLLLHFQFTVGFCETLQILHTPQSKERAKALLRKLIKHPVQLRDVQAVARYLLGQNVKKTPSNINSAAAPQRKVKRKKSIGDQDSPTTKRNSVQLTNGGVDYNAMTSKFEDLKISNKRVVQEDEQCIIS